VARPEWFIIELSEFGETASYPELVLALQEVFGPEVDLFIPIYHEEMGSYISVNVLFEGYVFVKDSETVRSNFINIKENRLFTGLLKSSGKIRMLDSRTIGGLRRKLKTSLKKRLISGAMVRIHDGMFENLDGEIISTENDGKIANVRIICRSREMIAPIPTTCLEKL
jgi:transcription antitermination factor NusG